LLFQGVGAACPGVDSGQWWANVPWVRGAYTVAGAAAAAVRATVHGRRPPVPRQMSVCSHHVHWAGVAEYVPFVWLYW